MRSFFGLLKLYENGDLDRPSLPRYLSKDGWFMVAFPKNAFSVREGMVHLGVSRAILEEFPDAHKQLTFQAALSHSKERTFRRVTYCPSMMVCTSKSSAAMTKMTG